MEKLKFLLDRPSQGMSAPALTHARRGAIAMRSSAPVHEDQVSRSPILESFIFRVFVQLGLNLTIFTVSRVSLDSINRLGK